MLHGTKGGIGHRRLIVQAGMVRERVLIVAHGCCGMWMRTKIGVVRVDSVWCNVDACKMRVRGRVRGKRGVLWVLEWLCGVASCWHCRLNKTTQKRAWLHRHADTARRIGRGLKSSIWKQSNGVRTGIVVRRPSSWCMRSGGRFEDRDGLALDRLASSLTAWTAAGRSSGPRVALSLCALGFFDRVNAAASVVEVDLTRRRRSLARLGLPRVACVGRVGFRRPVWHGRDISLPSGKEACSLFEEEGQYAGRRRRRRRRKDGLDTGG